MWHSASFQNRCPSYQPVRLSMAARVCTADVQITSIRFTFIQVSQLHRMPLKVSPVFSSTITGLWTAALSRPRGNYSTN